MFRVYIHVLHPHEVFLEKMTYYMAYVKMTKFDTKISLFMTCIFVLLYNLHIISVFRKTVHEHIEYGDIHADFFS
jgi:hypothetical protein